MRVGRRRGVLPGMVLAGLAAIWAGVAVSWNREGGGVEVEETAAAPLRLVLSLSARKLYVYEGGERTRTYTVAVGQAGHRTPQGNYSISKVVWNPWWRPPASGWAAGEKDTPPGPNNPMGRVKMYFRNLYYIHGTPHTGSLGQAVSHGCVRMSNGDAIALARLVHKYGSPNVSSAELDRLVGNSRDTKTIWLRNPVPLEVVTSTAEVHDGRLEIHAAGGGPPAEQVWRDALLALAGAGFELTALDGERLDDLIRAGVAGAGTVSVSLDDLRRGVVAGSLAGNH